MQKKSNAPNDNPPNGTKNGRPEEVNFVKKQVSQRTNFFENIESRKTRTKSSPPPRLSPSIPSIPSRLVGSVRLMTSAANRRPRLVGSTRAITMASVMRKLALRALPRWGSRSTRLGWVSIPSHRRDWGEGRSMRYSGRSGRHLRATRSVRLCQLGRSWHRKPPQC